MDINPAHEAGRYYKDLTDKGVKPKHALELTKHWQMLEAGKESLREQTEKSVTGMASMLDKLSELRNGEGKKPWE